MWPFEEIISVFILTVLFVALTCFNFIIFYDAKKGELKYKKSSTLVSFSLLVLYLMCMIDRVLLY